MNKIKIVGALILILLGVLALFSKYISSQNNTDLNILKIINAEKAFTQEISKNIFYIYKNKNTSTKQLDISIRLFIENMNYKDDIFKTIEAKEMKKEIAHITVLWNNFYFLVQNFRDKSKINSPYTNIILEKLVNNIYKNNVTLVVEFNKLIKMQKKYFDALKERNKLIQIFLFILLFLFILYFFTQLKDLMLFIQKFLQTSKNIITSSTVKGVKPIELHPTIDAVLKASNDFNFLINEINKSIDLSTKSMQNTTKFLEQTEQNIENLLELITIMDKNKNLDKELIKKEDSIIEALEEISSASQKLANLKKNLEKFRK